MSKQLVKLSEQLRDEAAATEELSKENSSIAVMREAADRLEYLDKPIPMRLRCEVCHTLHVDAGEFATKPHHTHACQACGAVWRPAIGPTVGVQFLPGYKDDES